MSSGGEDSGGLCKCCFRLLLTSSFSALFLYLALRTNRPTLSIESFSLLLSNKTAPALLLSFDLKLKNRNKDKGVYYDALALTFSNATTHALLANATFPPFYQGHGAAALRSSSALSAASGGVGAGAVLVEVATGVRYKVVFWRTKRERVRVGAALTVNGEGRLVRGKKGVKLSSSAARSCYRALLLLPPLWVVIVSALGLGDTCTNILRWSSQPSGWIEIVLGKSEKFDELMAAAAAAAAEAGEEEEQ